MAVARPEGVVDVEGIESSQDQLIVVVDAFIIRVIARCVYGKARGMGRRIAHSVDVTFRRTLHIGIALRFLNLGQLPIVDSQALEQQLSPVACALGQDLLMALGHDGNDHDHLFEAEDGRGIAEERESAYVGQHVEYDGGDGEDVGQLEEAGDGIFLEVADAGIRLMVGKGLEVVFERVQLQRLEAFPGELLCLIRWT